MSNPRFGPMPDFSSPSGVARWPSMIPRVERLCWRHSARSFTFPWQVPGATRRPLELRLEGICIVIEVLGGSLTMLHGNHRHVILANHAVAISALRLVLKPTIVDTPVLVHVMRTMPNAKNFLSADPSDRLSPWWRLVKFAGEPPGVFPLGLHQYARSCEAPQCNPWIGEKMILRYAATAHTDAVIGRDDGGSFFAFLASGLLHDQIIEQVRAGKPRVLPRLLVNMPDCDDMVWPVSAPRGPQY